MRGAPSNGRSYRDRRQFITLLGAAAAWPLAARAQQGERIQHIGAFNGGAAADDPDGRANMAAFRQALGQLGWTDGRNLRIDERWGGGSHDTMRKHAAELAHVLTLSLDSGRPRAYT